MRQKFNGRSLDVNNVPNCFHACIHQMPTPESAFRFPLLNEFVIEPFSIEECHHEKASSSECVGRMRPYSDAATSRIADESREACCSARPLAIGVVVISMSFALIYFLMIVPMTSTGTIPIPTQNVPSSTVLPNVTELVSTTTEDPLYQFIDDKLHRHQIPLIHVPSLYQIKLKLFVPWRSNVSYGSDNFAIEGLVRVHFISGGGSRILLHSDSEQHIGECVVRDEFGRHIFVKHVGRGFTQVLDLHLAADMIHGMNYTLDVAFRAHISLHKQLGLFAVPYNKDGERRYVVATQLQLSEARTVFPCIDIPEVKAPFETILVHPTGTTAVANMKENTTVVEGGWTTTTFHRTPPMSTYLFAFFVSDYPYLEAFSSKGVRTRVYCDPAKLESAHFMTDSISPLLGFYEDYFGIQYPLDKLDVVILPVLSVTAMENWGMITVRQAEGVYSEKAFPVTQKHNAQEIAAHEVAHQWFGNLVTMKWWNDLWLNEGFATMISVKAVDYLENTTWRYEDNTAELMCVTLRADQNERSIAISANKDVDIQRHLELHGNQKTIIYKKAAIIIRMIERLVQEDIFKQGLNRFLNTFLYKNADHEDLFNVLVYVHDSSAGGHLSGQNFSLSDVMDTWIRQPHFPVVHVTRKEGSIVTLRQEIYTHVARRKLPARKTAQVWKIPIFYDDPVSSKHKVFWITDKQPVVFDMAGQLVVDPHQLTYMRLRYDTSMYSDITSRLLEDHTLIPANSRSRLLDDTLAMAEHGQLSYRVPFNLSMYMTKETTYRPFQTFSAYLDFFLQRMFVHESWPVYKAYLSMIFGMPFDRLNKEGLDKNLDHDVDAYNTREIVVYRSCLIGYEPCVQMARNEFAKLRENCAGSDQLLSGLDCNHIPFYLRQHVYASAIEYGTQDDFDFLIDKWRKEHYMLERDWMFLGLCSTQSRENSDISWKELLKNRARENVRSRAVSCAKRITNQTFVLDMFYEQPEFLKEIIETAESSLELLLLMTNRIINYEEQLEKFESILKPFGNYIRKFRLSMDQARGRMEWRAEMAPFFAGNASETIAEMRKLHIII